jgi:cysteine desulfurase
MLYFDHNATTPLSARAKAAWLEAAERFPGNPSSPQRLGARADAALTDARERLARVLGCSPLDVVWTAGASESGNTVFHHFARRLDASADVWISAIEHPCVLESARHYFGARLRLIPVTRGGVVDLEWLAIELKSREQRNGRCPAMAGSADNLPRTRCAVFLRCRAVDWQTAGCGLGRM